MYEILYVLCILYVSRNTFVSRYTDVRNVLGMSNIKFPVTFVSELSSVISPLFRVIRFLPRCNKLCAMLRKIAEEHGIITNKNDIEKLQKDLDTLGEWAVENGMKINGR